MLRLGNDPEKRYRATFICQYGLCFCCNMTLISLRLFRKIWATREIFFGQMVYPPPPPPWQKISRTPMTFSMKFDFNGK